MAVPCSVAVAQGMLHVPVTPSDSLCPDLGCWAWGEWPGCKEELLTLNWGLGHLAAATGESPQLHERRQGEMALRAKGFTKIPVSNLKAERYEDAKDASRSSLSKTLLKWAGNAQEAAWAWRAEGAAGGGCSG